LVASILAKAMPGGTAKGYAGAVGLVHGTHRADRAGPHAAARERDIGARQIERRDLEGAESDGGNGRQAVLEPERAGGVHDRLEPHRLRDANRGAVERVLEGVADAHASLVAVLYTESQASRSAARR
jgi:hypothetical protein